MRSHSLISPLPPLQLKTEISEVIQSVVPGRADSLVTVVEQDDARTATQSITLDTVNLWWYPWFGLQQGFTLHNFLKLYKQDLGGGSVFRTAEHTLEVTILSDETFELSQLTMYTVRKP